MCVFLSFLLCMCVQLPPGTDISMFLTGLLTKAREFEDQRKVED